MAAIIKGTGSYSPTIQTEKPFLNNTFLDTDNITFSDSNYLIIEKFKSINGIEDRLYIKGNYKSPDLEFFDA